MGLAALLTAQPALALTLAEAVRQALDNYPAILAAQAERAVAQSDIQRAKGKHYPTVDFAGTRRTSGDLDNSLGPRMRLNLYASGAIEAEVDRERFREQALTSRVIEQREIVAFDTVNAYLRLLGALRLREVAQRNLDRHGALVADFEAIASIDQGRRFDLVQARARFEQVRFQLAERDTEIALAREALARFYDLPFEPAELQPVPRLPTPTPIQTGAVARTDASEATEDPTSAPIAPVHPSIEAARQELQSAQANVRVARGNLGPRVDAEARAGANSFSGLTFSWPAFDLSARAARDSATASLAGAQARVAEEERLVAEQQRSAFEAWRAAQRRNTIAEGQIDIAKQLVEVYREQFGIGRRNLLDLLNAYAELSNAEASAVTSTIDASRARHQIEFAAGRLTQLFTDPAQ